MKIIIILFSILLSCGLLFSQNEVRCGNGRWNVKILADKEAKDINFKPKDIGFKELKKFDKKIKLSKKDGDEQRERLDDEKQVYRITGFLKEWDEKNDFDYHLIILLDYDNSIVCEIPSPDSCPEVKRTRFAEQYNKCRNTVMSLTTKHGNNKDKERTHILKHKVKVEIEGVLFHDLKHKKVKGAMPHFLELHPVLNIKIIE
ncbi:MAG: hypothetical protein EPN82_14660 [Bacteroidetes bacterium]|nr:MAG: hypothetical protein EPN82_14660 [Bacteroidota bacterium]